MKAQSNTTLIAELLCNKFVPYDSPYELFPQYLFANSRKKLHRELQSSAKTVVYSKTYYLEDYPEIGESGFEDHPIFHPRFYVNSRVFVKRKITSEPGVDSQGPKVAVSGAQGQSHPHEHLDPERVVYNDWIEAPSEGEMDPVISSSEGTAGVDRPRIPRLASNIDSGANLDQGSPVVRKTVVKTQPRTEVSTAEIETLRK
jgi:hypothetical protein